MILFMCAILSFSLCDANINHGSFFKAHRSPSTHNESVFSNTCYLDPDAGPCRAELTMYYFNATSRHCGQFVYGGCQGNGNKYDTEGECYEACLDSQSLRPPYCSLSFDYGYCVGAINRYYFDKIYQTCKEAVYSGCGGNKNNFYNKETCEDQCRIYNDTIHSYLKPVTKKSVKKVFVINPHQGNNDSQISSQAVTPLLDTTTTANRHKTEHRLKKVILDTSLRRMESPKTSMMKRFSIIASVMSVTAIFLTSFFTCCRRKY